MPILVRQKDNAPSIWVGDCPRFLLYFGKKLPCKYKLYMNMCAHLYHDIQYTSEGHTLTLYSLPLPSFISYGLLGH